MNVLPTDNWMTLRKFAQETGYTERAIYDNKSKGCWPTWIFVKDGRKVMVNYTGYNRWLSMKASEQYQIPALR